MENDITKDNVTKTNIADDRVTMNNYSTDNLNENNKEIIIFNEDDVVNWVIGFCKIPFGQKVIKLQSKTNNTFKIMYWNGEKYMFDYIKSENLSNKPIKSKINVLNNLENEVSHLLFRNENEKNKYSDFNDLFTIVTNFKSDLSNKSDDEVYELINKINQLEISENKVETLDKLTNYIFGVFNPKNSKNIDYKSETIFVPLSEQFFAYDNELFKYYNSNWINDKNLNRIQGNSGEGVTDSSTIKNIFIEFKKLQKFLDDNNILVGSNEYNWLDSTNRIDNSKVYRIIFIGRNTWEMNNFTRYAEFIAILDTICCFNFIPLICVLIHEMNVNSNQTNFFPQGDTHKPNFKTEETWKKIIEVNSIANLNLNQDEIDLLYQNSRNIDLLLYSIVFSM